LVEAGLTGSDPFQAARAAAAYGSRAKTLGALHLTV
jgi:hypothetical protein